MKRIVRLAFGHSVASGLARVGLVVLAAGAWLGPPRVASFLADGGPSGRSAVLITPLPPAQEAVLGVSSPEQGTPLPATSSVALGALTTRSSPTDATAISSTSTNALTQPPPDADEGATRIRVPYRSQFDGSTFEWGNCGVSAIAMAMEYYGHPSSTHDVRLSINAMTGNWDLKVGVDWRYLKLALEQRGFSTAGPYSARGGYQTWTLDEILAQVREGRPVMLLVHYRSLPGHEEDEWIGDHYILFLGLTRDGDVIYHDPGFPGEEGANRTIDQATLERVWSNTWIGQNRTAMTIIGPQ